MTIYDSAHGDGSALTISTVASAVFDVSGAGDTVIAALALAIAGGLDVVTGAQIANIAAGIVVGKRGTAVVRLQELTKALQKEAGGLDPKIVGTEEAAAIVAEWKEQGFRVGFTNGCFDLLHPGHVELLKRSRALCDRLIVALNDDASVRRLKGETRPVQNEMARSTIMASIDSVDLVTLFDNDTPMQLIEQLRPDVLLKGADYSVATVVGIGSKRRRSAYMPFMPSEVSATPRIVSKLPK